ncbi:dihydropteroate synthase [Haloarcula onubensis]|uniref:dihydropteroate synthase n=1 Tax=Haloarcula onubensis TaxID=2950539 RepID=A0ABU2FIZ3_9EURY|nr:dihydropteroate synthase [Halomicroarcula sp. S3CR25-11]MDS0280718.1 dihydropteroate synthase [Halomicroarcula sp. S3CR25-11]
MQYHEAADYLESLQRRRPKLGTETTARMLSHLGDPQAGVDCVQVAGSNGKGSTSRLLAQVLRAAGLDVGVFTSPGLNGFREQVQVNGVSVPKARVIDFVERIDPCLDRLAAEDDMPTHFEVVTAMAVDHFGREDVDVAVLEVGIGGRYDATSAVSPVASAVTSVSLEHTELLGDTVAEIARDKAQVAPEDAPLVTAATGDALDAIRTETDVVTVGPADADVVAVENGMRCAIESEVSLTGPDWALETNLQLLGQHQAENAGVAATLARQVAGVDTRDIAAGLRQATLPGRFEILDSDPTAVLDGSHNPGAMATLADVLDRFDYGDLRVVFGAMADKDHAAMAEALPPVDTAYLARPGLDRAADLDTLAAAFEGNAAEVSRVPSVPEATERALADADADDFVLVTGSLYAVAEARDRWTRLVVPKAGGHAASERDALDVESFPDAAGADIDHHVLQAFLRPDQAERVARRFEAAGGDCHRSAADAPGKFVATVLSGTAHQLAALADALEADGHGLSHVAGRIRRTIDGPPDPLDTDGPAVMGILNVTPDSFHDGGEHDDFAAAVARAEEMVAAGADVIDVGGESTRPGADPVSVAEEIDRVVPVVEALADLDVPVSVDTRKAAVADAALSAGADIVNDVSGLSDPEMRFVVADHDAALVLMHSLSAPVDPDRTRTYDDVVDDVLRELSEQVLLAQRAGIEREQILVDPGCGFGKDADESFELVDRLPEFEALGCGTMVGHSRKSMFADVTGPSGDRLPPTLAVTAMAAERGADVVRVHDVAENDAVVQSVDATR